MALHICLTEATKGFDTIIDANRIIYSKIEAHPLKGLVTTLYLANGHTIKVKETPAEIMEIIKKEPILLRMNNK